MEKKSILYCNEPYMKAMVKETSGKVYFKSQVDFRSQKLHKL